MKEIFGKGARIAEISDTFNVPSNQFANTYQYTLAPFVIPNNSYILAVQGGVYLRSLTGTIDHGEFTFQQLINTSNSWDGGQSVVITPSQVVALMSPIQAIEDTTLYSTIYRSKAPAASLLVGFTMRLLYSSEPLDLTEELLRIFKK